MRGLELGALAALGAVAGLAALAPIGDGGGEARAEPAGAVEQGMIVVADGNGRLQAFYPDGTFAFKFGEGYHRVRSVAIGPDGLIVVGAGDKYAHTKVTAFHPDGSYAFELRRGDSIGSVGGPSKVVVAPDGRIVVVESGGRVQVFSPDGKFESVFDGGRFVAEGSWNAGHDVAVSLDGLIIVTDRTQWPDSGRIRAFNLNGTHAFSFDVLDVYPTQVAVGPDGRIVVLESASRSQYHFEHTIRVYHPLPNGTFSHLPLNGTSYQPGPNGTLVSVPGIEAVRRVSDIAVGPDGRIVVGIGDYIDPDGREVVGSGNNVSVFHPNGTRALVFGGYGVVHGGFDRPTDAAVGPDGRIVVAEPGVHSISVFHPNGSLAFAFGSRGHGDDAFYEPRLVAVGPDGRIVVGDTGKNRILVFEPDGTPALAFGSLGVGVGEFNSGVKDVAVAPDGSVVVVDGQVDAGRYHDSVHVFSPDGSSVLEIRPEGESAGSHRVAVGPDGRIVVVDHTGGVRAFHPDGTEAFAIQLGWVADGVAVGPDGRIVVVGGDRSQVFNPDGTFAFATEIDVHAVSVAVGPNREVVVVDDSDDRVQVFHPNGTFAFGLLPDRSEGKFAGIGPIAVGPLMPPAGGNPAPLVVALVPVHPRVGPGPDPDPCAGGGGGGCPALVAPGDSTAGNFTDLGDDAELLINVTGLAGGRTLDGSESSTVTFPRRELSLVTASFGSVLFPPGVTASHVPADGLLSLRVASDVPNPEQVQEALGGNGSEQVVVLVQRVVEVGRGESRIVFDQPIRISLEGQAGGRAFYIDGANGTIIPIDGECPPGGGLDGVDERLGGASECYLDAEDDKIIWTYHLTRFGTASVEGPAPQPVPTAAPPTPSPEPQVVLPPGAFNGTDGGGGAQIPPPNAGNVTLYAASWDCNEGTIRIVVNSGISPDISILSSEGTIIAQRGDGPHPAGRTVYEAPLPEDPIISIRAMLAEGSAVSLAIEAVRTGGSCTGEVVFQAYGSALSPETPTCSVALGSPDLSASARPGVYSQPIRQDLINSGTLSFTRVELEATPWRPASGAPPVAPSALPAPASGPASGGRVSSVLTVNLIAAILPASATEVSERAGGAGGYAALVEGTTVVAGGLEGGGTAPLWFRLNLAPYGGLQAGTSLVQSITYQAECAPPS